MSDHRHSGATLSQYVLKVHSRCDLACDHCYVYEHADQSWRRQPLAMSADVVRAAGRRIAQHATAHRLPAVRIVLHGGEPLLLGPRVMGELLSELRAALGPHVGVDLRMQTNGVRLSPEFCALFGRFDVRVGVSLDGGPDANDRHRRFRNGSGSYDRVAAGLSLLRRPENRRSYAGLLCTVDLNNDPIAVYEELLRHEPPRIDFLLPHGTWDQPPPRPGGAPAPYADWLTRIYDRWLRDGRPVGIRLFESLLSTAGGGPSLSEWVGLDPADLVVVETNGEWEQADSLKIAFDGVAATGLNVFDHSVDEVAALPAVTRRLQGLAGLSATCRACPVVTQCGGGLFAHRYSTSRGFDNPSVYCADLKAVIDHMSQHPPRPVTAEPPPEGFTISAEHLDRIASAGDDTAAVAELAAAQLELTRLLVRSVAERHAGRPHVGAGWELLCALDEEAPDAVDEVLRHPYIRGWAARCAADGGHTHSGSPGYLAGIAAAAAVHAGLPLSVPVAVQAGQIHLPTLGTVVPSSYSHASAVIDTTADGFVVTTGDDRIVVRHDAPPPTGWLPIRAMRPGLWLEDGDPHRDCHQWKPTDRLDDAGAQEWRERLNAAWRLVAEEVPDRAEGLRIALRTVVPLHAGPGEDTRASTARNAFGTVASTPAPADELAIVLVHEFQHGKLNAILDAHQLVDHDDPRRLKVGWRPDPRPIEGALHGTFAHQAVADQWRVRAIRGDADAPVALRNYRMYRDWTVDAVAQLQGSGALTTTGERFVANIGRSMAGWPH
ncbi:FxsB family cyclophane-forming radical SAM/SPASM peptide maturase [Dactylosporangium sp. CA-092794]|uniref:FxsB family cyclophane-forming radical SAM/SPASM peptide maturase n=1 Tax=Dactylosporangium sp. CA-092794 TaxID=3239929 RepID=UPI003D928913